MAAGATKYFVRPTHQTQPSPTDDNLYDSSDSKNEEGLFKRAKMNFWKSQSPGQQRRDDNDYVDDSDTPTSGDDDDNVDVNDDGTTTTMWTFLIHQRPGPGSNETGG